MNCKQCSKVIPDGFTDCPWCGATFPMAASLPRDPVAAGKESASAHRVILASTIASSALVFAVVSYFATSRSSGPVSVENCGYFVGRGAGAIILAALIVFGYCKMRGDKLRRPVQVLVILTLSSVLTMLTLALPARPHVSGIDEATVRRYTGESKSEKAPNNSPVNRTKWDPAARSLMKDIVARNQKYISEISALDETAKPLYTPESFRDAASIQEVIEQLNARLVVADKYSDWQPIFANMRGYVAGVDASADEKQKFLGNFEASLPKTLAVCKAISDKEHAWLRASLDLYQFALAKNGTYVWQGDNLAFENGPDSKLFSQKFVKARSLNAEFLQAYWQVRQAEQAMIAELGIQGADVDSPQTR